MHTRYVVHITDTDQYIKQIRYARTDSFEKAKLYLRKQEADTIACRWNYHRKDGLRYIGGKEKPEAVVLPVSVVLVPNPAPIVIEEDDESRGWA